MAASSSPNNPKTRLRLLAAILLLWILAIGMRLTSLQVLHYSEWMGRAQKQQTRTYEITPPRGIIYDRNGQELAMSVQVDSVFSTPNEVPDRATAAQLLSQILNIPATDLQQKLDSGKTFVWLARKVPNELGARVRELKLKGIYVQKEPKRFYPKGDLAAQVLGYVGLDDEGLGGIEQSFDERLRGVPGRMQMEMDARRKSLGGVQRQPEPGENIVLTLDQNIQYITEREIDRAMEESHAEAATIIVQNPRTGEILAMASRPTFSPNTFERVAPQRLRNRAIADLYEPGSMFKTVTVSAALEEKVTKPDDRYDVSQGFIVVGGAKMRDSHHMGVLTVGEIIAQSSNVGAIKIGMRLGDERLYKYARAFGYGAQTGIELPGETRGMVKPVRAWSKTTIGAMSMGQEVGISAIQAVSGVSTIANDGIWSAPRIVAGVAAPRAGAQTITFHPAEQRRVISPLTAAEMRKMMEGVVLFGTGRKAMLDGFSSAGKTGTAQKVDPHTGRYGSKYVASFVGFAPVNQPAITVAVILDSALGLHQGGQVSAPVFQRVTQQVLEYMHVSHDVEFKKETRKQLLAMLKDQDLEEATPDHPGEALPLSDGQAQAEPEKVSHAPVATAPAKAPQALPALAPGKPLAASMASVPAPRIEVASAPAAAAVPPTNGVLVNVDGAVVPSFAGKSLRAAVQLAQESRVMLEAQGRGIARDQSPPPGTRLGAGAKVVVRFSR